MAVSEMVDVVSLQFYVPTPSLWKLQDDFLEPVFCVVRQPLAGNLHLLLQFVEEGVTSGE
jgi:hypothetical protein